MGQVGKKTMERRNKEMTPRFLSFYSSGRMVVPEMEVAK